MLTVLSVPRYGNYFPTFHTTCTLGEPAGGGGGLACVGLSGSAGRMLRAIKAWLLPGATEHKCANTVHASLGSQ